MGGTQPPAGAAAWDEASSGEVVPVDRGGSLARDETFRPDSTRQARDLRPSFEQDGTVTAGNASQMADGAAPSCSSAATASRATG